MTNIYNSLNQDITNNPIINTSYGFAGREHDHESGLSYNRARYYDSSVGRFLQEDPHPGSPEDSVSIINKYTYAGNNPINYTDPTGLFKFRNFVALALTAVVTFGIGYAIGVAAVSVLGPAGLFVGPILGGITGGLIGGDLAYGFNRLLGGSREESSELRKLGAIVGAVFGALGGLRGAIDKFTQLEQIGRGIAGETAEKTVCAGIATKITQLKYAKYGWTAKNLALGLFIPIGFPYTIALWGAGNIAFLSGIALLEKDAASAGCEAGK